MTEPTAADWRRHPTEQAFTAWLARNAITTWLNMACSGWRAAARHDLPGIPTIIAAYDTVAAHHATLEIPVPGEPWNVDDAGGWLAHSELAAELLDRVGLPDDGDPTDWTIHSVFHHASAHLARHRAGATGRHAAEPTDAYHPESYRAARPLIGAHLEKRWNGWKHTPAASFQPHTTRIVTELGRLLTHPHYPGDEQLVGELLHQRGEDALVEILALTRDLGVSR